MILKSLKLIKIEIGDFDKYKELCSVIVVIKHFVIQVISRLLVRLF